MINYILCDDNKEVLKRVSEIITNTMMNNDNGYEIHKFTDYDADFREIIKSKIPNKIYILDIEIPTVSGIDIARKIRTIDYNSTIIFLTGHDEMGYTLVKKEFLFLSFINKYDNYEVKLTKAIKTSLKNLNSSQILKYNKSGVMYTIPVDDILYIMHDPIERKSVIKTEYLEIMIPKSLTDIKKELPNDFVYSHRSCIVNKNKIRVVDMVEHKIVFNNQETIRLVSSIFKKELEENAD